MLNWPDRELQERHIAGLTSDSCQALILSLCCSWVQTWECGFYTRRWHFHSCRSHPKQPSENGYRGIHRGILLPKHLAWSIGSRLLQADSLSQARFLTGKQKYDCIVKYHGCFISPVGLMRHMTTVLPTSPVSLMSSNRSEHGLGLNPWFSVHGEKLSPCTTLHKWQSYLPSWCFEAITRSLQLLPYDQWMSVSSIDRNLFLQIWVWPFLIVILSPIALCVLCNVCEIKEEQTSIRHGHCLLQLWLLHWHPTGSAESRGGCRDAKSLTAACCQVKLCMHWRHTMNLSIILLYFFLFFTLLAPDCCIILTSFSHKFWCSNHSWCLAALSWIPLHPVKPGGTRHCGEPVSVPHQHRHTLPVSGFSSGTSACYCPHGLRMSLRGRSPTPLIPIPAKPEDRKTKSQPCHQTWSFHSPWDICVALQTHNCHPKYWHGSSLLFQLWLGFLKLMPLGDLFSQMADSSPPSPWASEKAWLISL